MSWLGPLGKFLRNSRNSWVLKWEIYMTVFMCAAECNSAVTALAIMWIIMEIHVETKS